MRLGKIPSIKWRNDTVTEAQKGLSQEGLVKHIRKTEVEQWGRPSVPPIPSSLVSLLMCQTQEEQTQIICFDYIFQVKLVFISLER